MTVGQNALIFVALILVMAVVFGVGYLLYVFVGLLNENEDEEKMLEGYRVLGINERRQYGFLPNSFLPVSNYYSRNKWLL
jgi:hypothetical protein